MTRRETCASRNRVSTLDGSPELKLEEPSFGPALRVTWIERPMQCDYLTPATSIPPWFRLAIEGTMADHPPFVRSEFITPQPPPTSRGSAYRSWLGTNGAILFGSILFIAGVLLWLGNETGLVQTISFSGYVVGTAGALLMASGYKRNARMRDDRMRATLSTTAYAEAKAADRQAAVAALHAREAKERKLRRIAAPVCFVALAAVPAVIFGADFSPVLFGAPLVLFAGALTCWLRSREESQNIRLALAALGEASADASDAGLARAIRRELVALAVAVVGLVMAAIGWLAAENNVLIWFPGLLLAGGSIDRWMSFRRDTSRIRDELGQLAGRSG